MIKLDEIRAKELERLARERFSDDLADAELKVLRDSASSDEPPEPDKDAPRPEVGAEFLRWLATDTEAAPHIDPKGIRVYGATVPNKLDLEQCTITRSLDFRGCAFRDEINLRYATAERIGIFDSNLDEGINANGASIHGPLFLRGTESSGEIQLLDAEIMGTLQCSGAKLKTEGRALSFDRAKIGGGVFLDVDEKTGRRTESSGEIRLLGAEIKGPVVCTGASLKAKGTALSFDGAKVRGVFLDVDKKTQERFESDGAIRLSGVEIAGVLACAGAYLKFSAVALSVDRAKILGGVYLNSTKINETTQYRFESEGMINLSGAEITGVLDCSGAHLKTGEIALKVDGCKIGGSVFLSVDRTTQQPFEPEGQALVILAEIGGNLIFTGAKIGRVTCHNTAVKGDLIWLSVKQADRTSLSLTGTTVKNLRDDRLSWPKKGWFDADGLIYEELTLHATPSEGDLKSFVYPQELPLVARRRIEWLMRQGRGRRLEPQPWIQLRALLEKKGDHNGAKHVLYRFRCLQAEESRLFVRWARKLFAWLEEAPWRIAYFVLLTLLPSTGIFWYAGSKGALAPTERDAYEATMTGKPMSAAYPKLNPLIYTVENALPLVRLGQDDKWAPDPRFPSKSFLTNYWFLMWTRWVVVIWGWFQAAILGAALVERFKPK